MRADATKAENLLWQALRNKQLERLKFKRQVPLDGYILDFVCFEARLIVEVDGGQHSESRRDAARDRHFETQGFRTIRFWNDEIEHNLDAVCLAILSERSAQANNPLSCVFQALARGQARSQMQETAFSPARGRKAGRNGPANRLTHRLQRRRQSPASTICGNAGAGVSPPLRGRKDFHDLNEAKS
ncbi:MAG TPA: endonuclease domain-containing protein [Mesorhizobium sp.]|nr:endonuclease domain-containing protein [Mesorhizobium sp.]